MAAPGVMGAVGWGGEEEWRCAGCERARSLASRTVRAWDHDTAASSRSLRRVFKGRGQAGLSSSSPADAGIGVGVAGCRTPEGSGCGYGGTSLARPRVPLFAGSSAIEEGSAGPRRGEQVLLVPSRAPGLGAWGLCAHRPC